MPRLVEHRENFGDKAPIVEAIIDVVAPATVGVDDLRRLAGELAETFPSMIDQIEWGVQVEFNRHAAPSTAAAAPTPRGFLLYSPDRTRAVQIRKDGFTMSHLRPYRSWDALCEDALSVWPRFVAAARPNAVHRLGVRYINRLELPPDVTLDHWLEIGPAVPASLQFEPAEFRMRTVHLHPEHEAIGVVNLVQPYSEPPAPRVVVFDIDCYFQNPSGEPGDPSLWEQLDALRDFKNDIFFGSTTEHTLELFR